MTTTCLALMDRCFSLFFNIFPSVLILWPVCCIINVCVCIAHCILYCQWMCIAHLYCEWAEVCRACNGALRLTVAIQIQREDSGQDFYAQLCTVFALDFLYNLFSSTVSAEDLCNIYNF